MKRSAQNFLASILGAILLIGCTGVDADGPELSPSTYYGTQMFFSDAACPLSGKNDFTAYNAITIGQTATQKVPAKTELAPVLAQLVTAVLPTLIEKGVNFVSEFLKKQKEKLTGTAGAGTYVVTNNDKSGFLGCLTFVRGTFGTPTNSTYKNLGLAAPPDFAIEFAYVRPFTNKSAVYLEPLQVEFRNTVAERGDDKQILLTAEFTAPTVKAQSGAAMPPVPGQAKEEDKPDKPNLATFIVSFNKLKQGSVIRAPALRGMRTELAEYEGGFPDYANVRLTVIETETGGDLYVAASEVISDNKEKISPVLLKQLKKLLKIEDEE